MRKRIIITLIGIAGCAKTVLELGADGGSVTSTGPVLTEVTMWQGNESDCPADPPNGAVTPIPGLIAGSLGDVCDVQENQTCAYWFNEEGQAAYRGCTCFERNRSDKRWRCHEALGLTACPMVQPASGSNCDGHGGTTCPFPPNIRCSCGIVDPSSSLWSCESFDDIPQSNVVVSGPTDTSYLNKRINDLSATEANTWCAWYATLMRPQGAPLPPEAPVTSTGYISIAGYRNWDFFGDACMAYPLAPSQCAQNLALLGCGATLGELTDCVLTVVHGIPEPHGCGRFFEGANCEGTIVRRAPLHLDESAGGYAGGMNPDPEKNCVSLRVR